MEFESTAGSEGEEAGGDARTTTAAASSGFRIDEDATSPATPGKHGRRPDPSVASSPSSVAFQDDQSTRSPPRNDRHEDVAGGGGAGGAVAGGGGGGGGGDLRIPM